MKTAVPPQTAVPSAVDSAEVAETLSILKRDGYCVMKGIIPADAVGAVRD